MEHRIRGRIRYSTREGVERGRELFSICRLRDGHRLFNAHCEIDDPPRVVREVTIAFDPIRRPITAAVAVAAEGRLTGSGWYRFYEQKIEYEGWSVAEGRLSQSAHIARPIPAFGTHPMQADALLLALADPRASRGDAVLEEYFVCSADHRGATCPALIRYPTGLRVWHVGSERIEVEAGAFDAWHFRLSDNAYRDPVDEGSRNEPGKHPPYDLWVTADGNFVLLRAALGGYAQRRYELVSLEID